jgi:hypothetical protein
MISNGEYMLCVLVCLVIVFVTIKVYENGDK